MFKAILLVGVASGLAAGAFVAGAAEKSAVEVALSAGPVFPAKAVEKSKAVEVAPNGAQYRVRSGKSGFRYVACDRQRSFGASAVEFGCLSWSKTKGWGKSIRWYGRYELLALTGDLPAAPVETAIAGK